MTPLLQKRNLGLNNLVLNNFPKTKVLTEDGVLIQIVCLNVKIMLLGSVDYSNELQ